jgi:thiamine-phosphate pyrophosphorylase
MFDMTAAASRAWQRASQLASADGAVYVTTTHLFHGLLQDADGKPWQLLLRCGVDMFGLAPPPAPEPPSEGPAGEIHAGSSETNDVLARARELCRAFGEESSVATDHLLVALVEVDEGTRALLDGRGLQPARLREAAGFVHGPPIVLDEPLHLHVPDEMHGAHRILDAASNRAREALRVLEDFTRFARGDAFLSAQLKQLRHDLASIVQTFPIQALLEARDTPGDVGTALSATGEMLRSDLLDVVRAACKRLEEALRSLEEYGKLVSPPSASGLEAIRYRSYTLERALLLAEDARQRLVGADFYALVGTTICKTDVVGAARAAAEAGAQIVQLREKNLADREFLRLAREVRRVTKKAGALFVVNDRPDLARLSEADGVHLGQDDLPVAAARRIIGGAALVGVSTHNVAQLRQAILDGASYVGVGPVFSSATKGFAELAGLAFVREAMAATSLPAFAIGGITAETIPALWAAGARRVAVGAAATGGADPREATAELVRALRRMQ